MKTYLLVALVIILTIGGDYALKNASLKTTPLFNSWLALGAFTYALTSFGWVILMQNHNLGYIAVVYNAANIVALLGLGLFFFGETLTPKQYAGIGAAIVSTILMNSNA
ncbi:hypothetical protein [Thioclava kandeliae]|uniref:EamA domain-containing protein n=1 Tax=Thioclava kandeliae TaxID=3070818 RepID=A0ABV1SMF5_9RHOB